MPDARLYDLVINCVRALSLAPQALSEEVLLHETLFATFKAAYALPEMGRMELYRIFNELRVDMRTLLMDQKAEHLEKLLDNAIEAKAARIGQQQEVKEYLVGMLISRDNFALEDLLAAMAFQGTKISLEMLLDDTEMKFSRYSYMYIWRPKAKEWIYARSATHQVQAG